MFQKNTSKPNSDAFRAAPNQDRSDRSSKKETSSRDGGTTNVILSDVEITGTVKFKKDVVIDGKIDGEVFSDGCVTIGEKATVNAEIRSASVIVKGCVKGNIYASNRLELLEHAEVTGDIEASVLSMQAGAVLVGSSAVGAVPAKGDSSSPNQTEFSKAREERELAHA